MKIIFKLGDIMSYNTKQKDLIMDVLKKEKKSFTIKDVYNKLKDKVGLTTIYRVIDKLVRDGLINKSISSDNITYYEYLGECSCHNHFYLKCEKCGTMIHVDCDCIEDLSNHIVNEHNFLLNHEHIIIKGICKECR